MFPSDTNIESLLGIKLRPKLSQEMAEQANYLTGNIFHFKTRLWGTLQSAECLKKGRERETLRRAYQEQTHPNSGCPAL